VIARVFPFMRLVEQLLLAFAALRVAFVAGRGIANPLGAIASAAMLLRHTMHLENEASDIEAAIESVLDSGYRTRDIAGTAERVVSTSEMGQLVAEAVAEAADRRHAYHAV